MAECNTRAEVRVLRVDGRIDGNHCGHIRKKRKKRECRLRPSHVDFLALRNPPQLASTISR